MSRSPSIKEPLQELKDFLKTLPGNKEMLPEGFTPCDIRGFEHVMNVGSQFLYVTDLLRAKIVYVSPGIRHITGYSSSEAGLDMIYETIHPSDRRAAVRATIDALETVTGMIPVTPGEVTAFLNFRFRKKDGSYIRVMRQTSVLKTDDAGNLLQSLAIITDIDHLSKGIVVEGKMIRKETGEVLYHRSYSEQEGLFSKREREIIRMIASGQNSREIAGNLFISHNTVLTHRRNILHKAELKNTAELLLYSKEHGII